MGRKKYSMELKALLVLDAIKSKEESVLFSAAIVIFDSNRRTNKFFGRGKNNNFRLILVLFSLTYEP